MEENKNLEEVVEENKITEEVAVTDVEEQEAVTEKKKEYKGMTATKNGLFLRSVIGGFILYYGYTIFADIASTPADERTPLYLFIAVFGVAGLWIIIDSVKRLLKKEYED